MKYTNKRKHLYGIVFSVLLLLLAACEKNKMLPGPVHDAEVYIIGFSAAVGNQVLKTPIGKGWAFLVETIQSNPDTLMMFGIPEKMFNIPDEWTPRCKGRYLLPEEEQKRFKMRITYQESPEVLGSFPCNALYPSAPRKYFIDQYIIVKAKKIE